MLSHRMTLTEGSGVKHCPLPFKSLVWAALVGMGASIGAGRGAIAAESVVLTYQGQQRTVPVSNLETFATTGEAVSDDVRIFFSDHPIAARVAQDILDAEVYISPSFIERFGDSSLGEFVLLQLNKVIGTPAARENLEPLRVAMVDSFRDDNRFTLLELLENYPGDTVRLDFSELEPIHNDVQTFIEKVQPALEVAREFLADIVCECEPTDTADAATDTGAVDEDAPAAEPASPSGPAVAPEDAEPAESDTLEEGMVSAPATVSEADLPAHRSVLADEQSAEKASNCETP